MSKLIEIGAAVGGFATFVAACSDNGSKTPESTIFPTFTPGIVETLTPEATVEVMGPTPPPRPEVTHEEWQQLPASERIQRFWYKETPNFSEEDAQKEITQAVSQYYCENIPCIYSPEELETNTFFVNDDDFVEVAIESGNIRINESIGGEVTEEEIREFTLRKSGAFTTGEDQVFVGTERLEENARELLSVFPELAAQNIDVKSVLLTYFLAHEYGHANRNHEPIVFDPPPYVTFINGSLFLVKLEDFRMTLYPPELGIESVQIDEGPAEYMARTLLNRLGYPIQAAYNPAYELSSTFVEVLNMSSGVTFEEFTEYMTGEGDLNELFEKWGFLAQPGQNKRDVGAILASVMGMHASGNIDSNSLITNMNNYFANQR